MESTAATLARELRELSRKKGTHPLELLKQHLEQWRTDHDIEPCDYINLGNSQGKTPLHFAAQLRDDGLAEYLLSLRADPNMTTVRGHTALVYASGRGRSEMVLNLLEAGARARVRVVSGDTALSMGATHGLDEAALKSLREAESQETDPWLDFTQDERAIQAQADHILAKPHCAQWASDAPAPVAEALKQRAAMKKESVAATQSSAQALAAVLRPFWNQEEEFAEALLIESCKPSRKKHAQSMIREALLAVASSLSEQDLQVFIVLLLHILASRLHDISQSLAAGAQGPKQAKYGKSLATSASLSALKDLSPLSHGLTVKTVTEESAPWIAVDLLSPPIGVKLVSDAPHLEKILRRLCHADAWGSDFGSALRWLRMLRPSDTAEEIDFNVFNRLATVYVEAATAACRAGHSLKKHLRDNSSFLDEVHEVLQGVSLDGLLEAFKGSAVTAAGSVACTSSAKAALSVPSCGPPFLELPPSASIIMVDDAVSWSRAEESIKAAKLAAVDTEWWDVGSGPALIQIAVSGGPDDGPTCFLIDTWHYEGSAAANEFRNAAAAGLKRLFSDADLQIVGWSFQEDAQRLRELCGGEKCQGTFSVLDLQPISASLLPVPTKSGCMEGLAVTCARFLGKPLNKAEQCSDWRRRPLTDAQRCYAALDAVVLLDLHSVLMRLQEGSTGA
mmetsp:Transcript_126859/g.224832  ORF Transcript_126859/g.224832 Transcript_126859/m.224832 type:complete len:678 (+) Transcript_126859:35-2068(+)